MKAALITEEQIKAIEDAFAYANKELCAPFDDTTPINKALAIVESLKVKDCDEDKKWADLTYSDYPDYEVGNKEFFRGARWAHKALMEKNK